MAEGARGWGMRGVAVASEDADQAALVRGLEVVAVDHVTRLRELAEGGIDPVPPAEPPRPDHDGSPISPISGHPALRRCLEIAAAGAHSLLLIGPPGGGKTLALQRLPSLLPPLSPNEVIEVTRIAGVCGENGGPRLRRPFRAPHHGLRAGSGRRRVAAAAGRGDGGHRGVLFLDELGGVRRDALEALRIPLEEGAVTVTRTTGTVFALPLHAGGRLEPVPLRAARTPASATATPGRWPATWRS